MLISNQYPVLSNHLHQPKHNYFRSGISRIKKLLAFLDLINFLRIYSVLLRL